MVNGRKNFTPRSWDGIIHDMNIVDRGPYSSPFASIDYSQSETPQPYEGSVVNLLNDIEQGMQRRVSSPELALHPSRIVRALVTHKIASPNRDGLTSLLRDAISLGLDLYTESQDPAESVRNFRQAVTKSGLTDLLSERLVLPLGKTAWRATNPDLSAATAMRLADLTTRSNILFIALANGGVAAGMDVFLQYQLRAASAGSEFYVCRYSINERSDPAPFLAAEEIAHLRNQGKGKDIVVFDENRTTGQTLTNAVNHFQSEVFSGKQVIPLTNLDERLL